jgi:predicted ATPase
LLKTLPGTAERAQKELLLQVALGVPLIATKGYASVEVEQVYISARELCQQVGETSQLFPALMGLRVTYSVRGETQRARELGEQLLRLAESVYDHALLLQAHYALAIPLFAQGELTLARAHLEQSLALYDPRQHRSLAFLFGTDFGVTCLSYAAFTLWHLGYPDQALRRSHESLILAQELSHPVSLAYGLSAAARLYQYHQEGPATQELAETEIALCSEQGFPLWLAMGTILRGWALVEQGQVEEGIAQMRQGLMAFRATGAEQWRPYFLALLAGAYRKVGQAEDGLSVLSEALAGVHKKGEREHEAELYRLKGTLTLQSKVQSPKSKVEEEAEGYFLTAIEIAQSQQAKSLELRATMSLARLWQQQGKRAEAHKLLSEVYNWFTEGFDTKDLQEAKALLDSLT